MASWHADFVLGDWRVSPKLNRITKDGRTVSIKHKSMAVLVFLADAEGEVLTRDEILDRVWPGMEVTDDVLTQAIHELRNAFDDDARHPRIFETIPRVGFRLIAPATVAEQEPLPSGFAVSVAQPSRRYLLGAFAAIVIGAILWTVIDRQSVERNPVITAQDSTSIAVLPFVNRSNIAEDAFFVEGMHDDLLTLLSRLSSIEKVISRTSTEQYRDTTKPIPQIGQELGVASILEGAVQRSGNQIRINVQLIDTETEQILWADSYDRDLTAENLFAIQSEITREIVAALHGVLSEQENEALQVMPTNSLDAYAEFVLGRHELAKRSGEAILRAKTHFEKAIELDADYALAYVGLADAYILQPEYLGTKIESILAPAQTAINGALSIDPLSGEAHTSLAGLRQFQNQPEESERYYLKAIELSPGYATAYHWYYTMLRISDRYEEALVQLARAVDLDPLSPILTDNLALMYRILGRHQDAKSTVIDGLERNPDFPVFYTNMALLLIDEGRLGEALKWAQAASKLNPSFVENITIECSLYLDLGDDQSGESCYEAFNNAYPEAAFGYMSWLHYYQSQFEVALEVVRQMTQRVHAPSELRKLAWLYVAFGDSSGARSILEEIDPNLFGDGDVVITTSEIYSTVAAAYSLHVDDETDRADYLFDQALDAMQSMHRFGGYGHGSVYGYGVLDVFIHVTRGDEPLAILALRDAVEMGWRSGWWELRFPHYAAMQDNPEWLGLVAEIEADIRQQRQWFEEHKDDPLF
ncbi:MAG: winged helix-turn-helix domain-containing protein [Proteobacteria bacterium]|nr:winged helix-turn-helix domain-containing protein [Pseudomonadota bacterium]